MTPEYMLAFFTEAMTAANLLDPDRSGPMIIWAFIEQRTKGFGFIEFRTLAEAESVYALNGIELLGRKLHVNRSREYAHICMGMARAQHGHGAGMAWAWRGHGVGMAH